MNQNESTSADDATPDVPHLLSAIDEISTTVEEFRTRTAFLRSPVKYQTLEGDQVSELAHPMDKAASAAARVKRQLLSMYGEALWIDARRMNDAVINSRDVQ